MQVPDGWQSVRLGDVADIAFSGVDKKTVKGEVPVELCNYTDVFYNRRIRPGMGFMAATASPVECQRYALRKGDVLFTKDSETPEEIGIPSYVVEDMPNVLCGYHLGLARPANGTVNGAFLARTLASEASAREFARIANGVTRFGLTLDATRSLPILLPPLPEQPAIAAVLDSIDEAIEGVEAVITATERLRDALLHELLTRGVPGWHTQWKDVPGIGTIPAAWDVVRLGDVAEVNPRRPKLDVEAQTLLTFIPMAAVAENCSGIASLEQREYREIASGYTYFEEDDVLFAKITPCLQNGKHALACGLIGGFGFGTTEFHVIRAGSGIDPRHLFRVLTQPFNIDKCARSFSGTAGQQRVQPETIKSLPIRVLPPLPEQRAIAKLLDGVDVTLAAARREREGLQLLKESTADALLTGRVRVEVGKRIHDQ